MPGYGAGPGGSTEEASPEAGELVVMEEFICSLPSLPDRGNRTRWTLGPTCLTSVGERLRSTTSLLIRRARQRLHDPDPNFRSDSPPSQRAAAVQQSSTAQSTMASRHLMAADSRPQPGDPRSAEG